MRRAVIMLALAGGVIVTIGLGATQALAQGHPGQGSAQGQSLAQGEGVQGTLRHDGDPVAGVTINVYAESGQLVGSAESAADGTWMVPVPGSATYRVELDVSTLPDRLVVASQPVLQPFVRPGQVNNVLFRFTTGTAQPPATPPTGGPPPAGTPTEQPPDGEGAQELPGDPEEEPGIITGPGPLDREITTLYSGIHFGLIIALAAVGLSLIYGTMGLVNFAHGELVSFGALAAVVFNTIGVFGLNLHLLVAAPIAVALGALFGYAQDRFFWGWLRRRGTGLIVMMIVSIGVALLLRNMYLYLLGGGRRPYAQFNVQEPINIGPLFVEPKALVTDAIAVVVLLAVTFALLRTRIGKAVRAVADNAALAAASGINVDRVIRLVWSLGAGLAALAGVILAMQQTASFQMGFQMLLLIFAAVVAGGLGTAFGAVAGGLLVGVLIQMSTLWIDNEFKYVAALALLIVVLLVRPQGLLGRRERVG